MKDIYSYAAHLKLLAGMPPHTAVKKIIRFAYQKTADKVHRIKAALLGGGVGESEFRRSLQYDVHEAARRFRERTNCLVVGPEEAKAIKDRVSSEIAEGIVRKADAICAHLFDLLGSGESSLGAQIAWHRDFKSGHEWKPRTYYKDIAIPYGRADIKVPWELSRFNHLILLGQAYWLSSDEKYAREFREQVTDWMKRNPPLRGPNWACTMDVAIRASNWLVAWEFFKKSPSIDDSFVTEFLKSIFIHGAFIRSNLEWSDELTSNHYLADIAGLFFIATLAPVLREADSWRRFAMQELEMEMRKQVYDDGCDFEASTCYHRLVLEMFFYPALAASREGLSFSDGYMNSLKKMFHAVLYLLKPNGRMPQIGDNDSGRFLIFDNPERNPLDMRYLLSLGSVFFNEAALKVGEFGLLEDTLWLFGEEGRERWNGLTGVNLSDIGSEAFPYAGWYVARYSSDHLMISCGPNGQNNNGGHGHNDKLSFELCAAGEDIIVDPGTYIYTADPAERNRFRATCYHNSVEIMGEEQNRFVKGFLFSMINDSRAKVLEWTVDGHKVSFSGEHYGYLRLETPVIHRRVVTYDGELCAIQIVDSLSGEGEISMVWNLHFAPGCEITLDSNRAQIRTPMKKSMLVDLPAWVRPERGAYSYSPAYGRKQRAEKIYFTAKHKLPMVIEWSIIKSGKT